MLRQAPAETVYQYADFKLWQRELIYRYIHKDHVHSQYVILWEDPAKPDEAATVTLPAPVWMGMALHGGILPPVEVYHQLAEDEAQADFKYHTRGDLLHDTPPLNAMTEEQAIQYLIQKDLPPSVWRDYTGNRVILRVIQREGVPQDRTSRMTWQVSQATNGVEPKPV